MMNVSVAWTFAAIWLTSASTALSCKPRRWLTTHMALSARLGIKRAAFVCIVALCLTVFRSIGSAAEMLSGSIDAAARASSLPTELLTRLFWVESRFLPIAVSPAGAQGVAQFMPATAAERGLLDPFNPEQAIPQAARLLADLTFRFGNIGLGLAAYNAGPGRTAKWLGDTARLPDETRRFVTAITGYSPEEWAASARSNRRARGLAACQSCALLGRLRIADFGMEHARMLPILAQSGRLLRTLEGSGRPLPILEGSGRPLPILEGSGRPLPILEGSGRPLPILEGSGRALPVLRHNIQPSSVLRRSGELRNPG